MTFLERLQVRPSPDSLSASEQHYLHINFDVYAGEVIAGGATLPWNTIDEVEVVRAPRIAGPAGWLVRHIVHGDERYHIGIYAGEREAVLPNAPRQVAEYVVHTLAFYAPQPVRYRGVEGLTAVRE